MTSESQVYIAGVGFSPAPPRGSPAKRVIVSLVSAATKALLDAGLTYDDVFQGVRSARSKTFSHGSEAFKAFDEDDIPIDEVEGGSELDSSFYWVRDRSAHCVLMIAAEKSAALAFVLVSDKFLGSHPYMKDSAVFIRESDASRSKSKEPAEERLPDVCQKVWALRGWSDPRGTTGREECLYYKGSSSKSFELSRADGRAIPEWKEVEHKQDGKHRLGYNPATQTRDVSQEDFEAVRASAKGHGEADNRPRFDRAGGDRAALAKL